LWSANAYNYTWTVLSATPNTETVVFLQCHPHLLDTTLAAIVNQPKYIQVLYYSPRGAARGPTLEEKLGKGVRNLGGILGWNLGWVSGKKTPLPYGWQLDWKPLNFGRPILVSGPHSQKVHAWGPGAEVITQEGQWVFSHQKGSRIWSFSFWQCNSGVVIFSTLF
jgi:hypothetical protein